MNLWSFALEEWDIENMAECRSDAFGDVIRWDEPYWVQVLSSVTKSHPLLSMLCRARG